MCELINATKEGSSLLRLKNNDRDSTTSVQKSKILLGQWLVKAGGGGMMNKFQMKAYSKKIQHDIHVKLEVSKGKSTTKVTYIECVSILGLFTKTYNSWYLCDMEKQTW